MGRGEILSWKGLFITGLLLSLAPFSFEYGNYVFHYAVLGYGLIAMSFLFKKNRFVDIVVLLLTLLIILSMLINSFEYYFVLQLLFGVIIAVDFIIGFRGEADEVSLLKRIVLVVSKIFAILLIVILPIAIILHILQVLGVLQIADISIVVFVVETVFVGVIVSN